MWCLGGHSKRSRAMDLLLLCRTDDCVPPLPQEVIKNPPGGSLYIWGLPHFHFVRPQSLWKELNTLKVAINNHEEFVVFFVLFVSKAQPTATLHIVLRG